MSDPARARPGSSFGGEDVEPLDRASALSSGDLLDQATSRERDARRSRATHAERRLDLEARYVLALAEALPRSPDTVALLLRAYCE